MTFSINELPSELLGLILGHSLPSFPEGHEVSMMDGSQESENGLYAHIVHILLVCRLWSEIALATPMIWTTVLCHEKWGRSPEKAFSIFETFMQRSKALRVDVSIVLRGAVRPAGWENGRPLYELDEYMLKIQAILAQNAHRIRSLAWEGRGPTLWPLNKPLPCLTSMHINFHHSLFFFHPFDPMPSLRYLQVESGQASDLSPSPSPQEAIQDLWQHVNLSSVNELYFCTTPRAAITMFTQRCPNVTSLIILSAAQSRTVASVERLSKLRKLSMWSDLDWLSAFLRPHTSTLTHLSLSGSLNDIPLWVTFPSLPTLQTLEIEWDDGVESLGQMLEAMPNLLALHIQPTRAVTRISPLLSYLGGAPKLFLSRSRTNWGLASGADWDKDEDTNGPVPRLRLLRVRFESGSAEEQSYHGQGAGAGTGDYEGAALRASLHSAFVQHLPSIYEPRADLHVQVILPEELDAASRAQLDKIYHPIINALIYPLEFSQGKADIPLSELAIL